MRAPAMNMALANRVWGNGAMEVGASPLALSRQSSGNSHSMGANNALLAGRSCRNQPQKYTMAMPMMPWKKVFSGLSGSMGGWCR